MTVDWVRLRLDLETFEEARFLPYLRRCQETGTEFTTMADLGDTADRRRAPNELNRTCSAGIPEPGQFYTFEEYLAERVETPTYDPRGVVLAVSDGEWVGLKDALAADLSPSGQRGRHRPEPAPGVRRRPACLSRRASARCSLRDVDRLTRPAGRLTQGSRSGPSGRPRHRCDGACAGTGSSGRVVPEWHTRGRPPR